MVEACSARRTGARFLHFREKWSRRAVIGDSNSRHCRVNSCARCARRYTRSGASGMRSLFAECPAQSASHDGLPPSLARIHLKVHEAEQFQKTSCAVHHLVAMSRSEG